MTTKKKQKLYDYIICGAGLSGLTIAYYLSKSNPQKTFLIIDERKSNLKNKTFSFWKEKDAKGEFDSIIFRQWNHFGFKSDKVDKTCMMKKYLYCTIRGDDYEKYIRNVLQKNKNIKFEYSEILDISESSNYVSVQTTQEDFSGKIIFNSIYDKNICKEKNVGLHSLTQYFVGWEIQTSQPNFDPKNPVLFDFKPSIGDEWNFFYTLPYSPNHALIENVSLKQSSEQKVKDYIEKKLKILDYKIIRTEKGCSDMTNFQFKPKTSDRIINIGKPGGLLKPSTGYGFTRIIHYSKYLAGLSSSELLGSEAFAKYNQKTFFKKSDSLLLHILEKHPVKSTKVFETMFKNINPDLLLKFLDEKASLIQIMQIGLGLFPVMDVFAKACWEDVWGIKIIKN